MRKNDESEGITNMNYRKLSKRLIKMVRDYREENQGLREMYLEGEAIEKKALKKLQMAKDQLDEVDFILRYHQELTPEKK